MIRKAISARRSRQRGPAYIVASRAPRRPGALLRAEQVARDDDALDLRGAFIDLEKLGVAHQFLDGVLLRVPIAPENLNRVGRGPHGSIGTVGLGVARRDRRQIALVDLPRGLVRQ